MNAPIQVDDSKAKSEHKTRTTRRPPMPDAHADVALGDIHDVCALMRMSPSWVHDRVAKGEFPAPVLRAPRCTRWKIAHVREYILKIIDKAALDPQAGEASRQLSKRASDGASAKRASEADKCDLRLSAVTAE